MTPVTAVKSGDFDPEPKHCQGDEANTRIYQLANMPRVQYEKERLNAAKALGIRAGALDSIVKADRKGKQSNGITFDEIDPWPDPVSPSQLLTEISATVRRFIVCHEETAHAVALWVAMTWFIDVVQIAPLAIITAPEKRCGKSQLLALIGRISFRPLKASNITPSALFRSIEAWSPTLLIDEADAFMKDNEELRGILNCGHTRDAAYIIRTVGDAFTPTQFNVWGAKALAGIGHLADTLMDRAVTLELRRKLPHEEVERIRYAEPNLFETLASKLARFSDDFREDVRRARPDLPQNLNDRAQDNWEPLLAIADVAGGSWPELARRAALKLSGTDSPTMTVGTELLSDIQEIFSVERIDRVSTADLIQHLCSDDERPWATYNRGKPIAPRQIAKKLRDYGVVSNTIRFGTMTAKGYTFDQFEEVFSRYLATPSPEVTTSQVTASAVLGVTDRTDVTVTELAKVTDRSATSADCDVVTDNNEEMPDVDC